MKDDRNDPRDTMIDAHLADTISDLVEHTTELRLNLNELRWRMIRGELSPMVGAAHKIKNAVNALKNDSRALGYQIDGACRAEGSK